jgi:hypothetical protein
LIAKKSLENVGNFIHDELRTDKIPEVLATIQYKINMNKLFELSR